MTFAPVPLALVVLGMIAAGCGSTVAPSAVVATAGSSPAASPSASAGLAAVTQAPVQTPSASPSQAIETAVPPPRAEIQPRIAVRVTVAELNIRQGPSTSAEVRRVVKKGTVFILVGFGPIDADGYRWWWTEQVVTVDGGLPDLPEYPGRVDGGYIAVQGPDGAYVEPLPARCPSTGDLRTIIGMLAGEQLACFGGRPLVVEGVYGCWICGDFEPVVYEPAWLAHPSLSALWPDGYRQSRPLNLHLPASVAEPRPGAIIRATGHFDDARSSDCRIKPGAETGLPSVDHEWAATWCRQHFVVEDYELLGTDPEFPPS